MIIDGYPESNQSAGLPIGVGQTNGRDGQIFQPDITAPISMARFFVKKTGAPTGNAVAYIFATTGTPPTAIAAGAALATSLPVDVASLGTDYAMTAFEFATMYRVTAGTRYAISIGYAGGDADNYITVGSDGSSPTHEGNMTYYANAGWWASGSANDVCFEVHTPSLGTQNTRKALKQ